MFSSRRGENWEWEAVCRHLRGAAGRDTGPEGAPSRMGAGLREAEPDRSPLQGGVLGAVAEVARNEGAEMAVLLQNLIRRDFHFQQ